MLLILITKRPQYASQVIKHLEISTVFHDQVLVVQKLDSAIHWINIQQLFLEHEWAIDSETMRARGIIVLVKSN